MSCKIGIGYDIHRLVEGRKLLIGGVAIPYSKGLLGHSDADVLIHALCDALLGAAGEPDIGEQFPDTDDKYRNISSAELLRIVNTQLSKKGFTISNIDTVVIAQEPHLSPFKKEIRLKIAQILGIEDDRVSVKAKTTDGVGELGKKEAIACYAVAMIRIKED